MARHLRRFGLICFVLSYLSFALAACSFEGREWNHANSEGSIAGYETYLEKYPDGEHAEEAMEVLEDLVFEAAKASSTEGDYRVYLDRYPQGRYRDQVFTGLQKAVMGWSFEVEAVREVYYGKSSRGYILLDPEERKGLAVKLRTSGIDANEKINCDGLSVAVNNEGETVHRPCWALAMSTYGDDNPKVMDYLDWHRGTDDKGPEFRVNGLILTGDESLLNRMAEHLWHLYVVPPAADEFQFLFDGKPVSDRVPIGEQGATTE